MQSRSPIEWSVRLLLAVVASAAGYFSVQHAIAYSLRSRAVEQAAVLAPYDGRILSLLSELQSAVNVTPAMRSRSDRSARAALSMDPTAVAAVATLGVNAEIRGERAAAKRFFAYSQRVSRRDLRTRLWVIEDAVERGDIAGALRSHDIALRTSRAAPDLLYPILAGAISEPDIRAALARTLVRHPVWGDTFTDYVSGSGPEPTATVELFKALQRDGVLVSGPAQVALIALLMERRDWDDAWSYYASIRNGADRRQSRNPDFGIGIDHPTLLDWVAGAGEGISSSVQRADTGSIFDFSAAPSTGGLLLRQGQLLPPGEYVLEGRGSGIDQPAASRPYWSLACHDGREIGRVEISTMPRSDSSFKGRLRVPDGCPMQFLSLIARPTDSTAGVSGQIRSVLLRLAKDHDG